MPTLQDVDNYSVPKFLSDRVAIVNNFPVDFCEGLIREAKRFLYLSVVSGEYISPSNRVDLAWHEMLMYTEFYKDFCNFLGKFIHHVPNPPDSESGQKETFENIQKTLGQQRRESPEYTKTKILYKKYFDIDPDPLFWP
jgi:hypothetical protein